MRSHVYRPRAPLDRFVALIWTLESEGQPHARERLLPDGSVELVVDLAQERFSVYEYEDGTGGQSFRGSVIAGPQSRFFVIDTAEKSDVVGVHFRPGGAYPFLRVPGGELHNVRVGLEDLWGVQARELRERLLAAGSPQARVRVMEQALLAAGAGMMERHPAVAFALNAFHGTPEMDRISEVTERIALSPRRFIEVFTKEVGLTPKLYCRVRRFQRVLKMISAGDADLDWAEVALSCGYFDQAHFNHDFLGFSGICPSRYLAERTEHYGHVPIRG
jgi:AraC-like DNA-binding protein